MIINSDGFLNLEKISTSGQCFRWNKIGKSTFQIIAHDDVLIAEELNTDKIWLSCSQREFDSVWKDYLDLDTNYHKIVSLVRQDDRFMNRAVRFGTGIRILHQEPFETLISFIISQQRSIANIRKTVEMLSVGFGKPINRKNGLFAFPKPEVLAGLTRKDLAEMKLGYRDKYIINSSRQFVELQNRNFNFDELNDRQLLDKFKEFHGVGEKIASCVLLYAFRRLDTFPIDRWISRVLAREYPNGYDFESYTPYNGVFQLYMFNYYRNHF